MNKFKHLLWAILLIGFVACSDETPNVPTDDSVLTEDVTFDVEGEIKSIGLREHYQAIIKEASESNDEDAATWLEYAQAKLDSVGMMEQEFINQAGANWNVGSDGEGHENRLLGYEYATIRYKSIDHNGKDIMLSTLVVWPFNNIIPDPDADNVIIGCHITISKNSERPTNYSKNSLTTDVGMLATCAISYLPGRVYENLVIIPDYQGYGATHGEVHPYLSQDLTARQVVDGVKAGIKFYEEYLKHKLEKNWKSLSTGYSQGGSVAMAVQRYIEKNNLASELNFVGSVCGSGPYDPKATLQTYIDNNEVYMPVAVGMMIKSMCSTNPRLMGKYTPKDFMTEQFINTGIIEMIDAKNKSTDEVGQALLDNSVAHSQADSLNSLRMYRLSNDNKFYEYRSDTKSAHEWQSGNKTSYAKTTDLLRPEVIDWMKGKQAPEHKEKMEALLGALEDNTLYKDWIPQHYMYMLHSVGDEVVPFSNYEKCIEYWGKSKEAKEYVNGMRYKGLSQTHVSFGKCFFVQCQGLLLVSIINGRADNLSFDNTSWGF